MTTRPSFLCLEGDDLLEMAEKAAARCLEHCIGASAIADLMLPIPIERWIESPLGIDFEIRSIATRNARNILGLARYQERQIVINETLCDDEARLRFTVAHELGHLWMHGEVTHEWTDAVDDARSLESCDHALERQADRFAAAFLMPRRLLYRELLSIAGQTSLGEREAMTILLCGSSQSTNLWKSILIPELWNRFAVSRSDLLFRLSGLKLPDNAPILLTRTLIELQENRI